MITWKLNKISIQQLSCTGVANVSFVCLEAFNDTMHILCIFVFKYNTKK